jgi:hypothetical protein
VTWALLLACGVPAPLPSHDAGFPHPASYDRADLHGADALRPGADCAACHGGFDGPGPPCAECHPVYPHDPAFAGGELHGAAPAGCDACHGPAGDRAPAGIEGAACTHCHSTYPHPDGWDAVHAHGAATLARGGPHPACTACHIDPTDPSECAECHAYPHPDGHLDAHGAAWVGGARACGGCHGTARAAVSCDGCHLDVPHPDGWATRGHLPAVQARGAATCEGCHPAGTLVGPTLPQSCAPSCHGAAP